jgi:hypothetical protein
VLTSSGYKSDEDDELGEDGNYLDIIRAPSYSYHKIQSQTANLSSVQVKI